MKKRRRQTPVVTPNKTYNDENKGASTICRVRAKTPGQGVYLDALYNSTVTVCSGPAGTGKTFMACGYAARLLSEGKIDRVIIVRPLVSCGTDIGILPGNVTEKISPYHQPLIDAFSSFFDSKVLKELIFQHKIDIQPLELMRGLTLRNAIVICDEAQNATLSQLRMLLTRIGDGCHIVITGDASQSDVRAYGKNPLADVVDRFSWNCHRDIAIVQLGREDIVRHPLIQWMDERLTLDMEDIKRQPQDEEDNDTILAINCPACRVELEYDKKVDGFEVEQVECWNCKVVMEIPEYDEDPYLTDIKLAMCVKSRPVGDDDGITFEEDD